MKFKSHRSTLSSLALLMGSKEHNESNVTTTCSTDLIRDRLLILFLLVKVKWKRNKEDRLTSEHQEDKSHS